jgi:hypothetical protein
MPTEFRFEDLDLREEPQSGKSDESGATYDAYSDLCTRTCTGSHNTCRTYLC